MKYTKNNLREVKIFNSWDIASISKAKIFVCYSSADYGRAYRCAKWQLVGIGFKTDRDAHWTNDGSKTFNIFGKEEKEIKKKEIFEFAQKYYGITEWEKDPFGGFQIKGAIQRAVENKKSEVK